MPSINHVMQGMQPHPQAINHMPSELYETWRHGLPVTWHRYKQLHPKVKGLLKKPTRSTTRSTRKHGAQRCTRNKTVSRDRTVHIPELCSKTNVQLQNWLSNQSTTVSCSSLSSAQCSECAPSLRPPDPDPAGYYHSHPQPMHTFYVTDILCFYEIISVK